MSRIQMMFRIALLPAVAAASFQVHAIEPADAAIDPSAPYQAELRNPVTHRVDLRAVITPPYGTKVLRVWVPIPPSDNVQSVKDESFETFPDVVKPTISEEPLFGNRFAYFELKEPKGAQMITHRFTITTHELYFHLDPEKVSPVKAWPASFAPFLRSESQAVVVSAAVKSLASEIVPAPAHELGDVARVIDWISSNMKYDHSSASLRASSEWALEKHAGHCSDYHGLCSAFSRAMGYPARVTYGMNTFAKNSPSHCKAEIFVPGYGWVSFDVSETQRLCEKIAADDSIDAARKKELIDRAKGRLFSGFRDNTWFLQTRGTDYDLAPRASRRVAVVRTIYAEADGQALPEPDPGDKTKREFAWMTLHSFEPDHPVAYAFTDLKALESTSEAPR
jgi:transglutaminase-like putative cysteine protease